MASSTLTVIVWPFFNPAVAGFVSDEAMLKEGAARLAALHATEATAQNKVVALKKGAE